MLRTHARISCALVCFSLLCLNYRQGTGVLSVDFLFFYKVTPTTGFYASPRREARRVGAQQETDTRVHSLNLVGGGGGGTEGEKTGRDPVNWGGGGVGKTHLRNPGPQRELCGPSPFEKKNRDILTKHRGTESVVSDERG